MTDQQMYEGVTIKDYVVKLPTVALEGDHYKTGTRLRLAVDVHVEGIRYERDKEGNFVRVQMMKFDDVSVIAAYDPSAAVDGVGGSLAAGAVQADPELPITAGRTGDQWPPAGEAEGEAEGGTEPEPTPAAEAAEGNGEAAEDDLPF